MRLRLKYNGRLYRGVLLAMKFGKNGFYIEVLTEDPKPLRFSFAKIESLEFVE